MTIIQTIILAIVQGITELFPISSVGHSVITPYVFGWKLDPLFLKENFLPFVVMMHLGTSIALIVYFRKDWAEVITSVFGSGKNSKKIVMLIIIGTLPAAIIGFVFEKKFLDIFSNVRYAAIFLIINGILLYVGENSTRRGRKSIENLNYRQAAVIGLFQSLALIPGFSRSGASMTAGFWMGLKHEASAKFSMLLATPIIAGAGILEVPKLFKPANRAILGYSIIGGIVAAIVASISITLMMKWFHKKEVNAMRPFSYYCAGLGVVVLVSSFFIAH